MFWKRKSNTRRQTLCRYCILTQRNNRPKYFIAGTCLVFNSTSQSFAALTSQLSSLTLEAEIYRWESNTKAAGFFFLKKLNILCPRPVVRKKERFFLFCGYFFEKKLHFLRDFNTQLDNCFSSKPFKRLPTKSMLSFYPPHLLSINF